MHINETFKFILIVLLLTFATATVFTFVILVFPFSLSLQGFTLIYWILSIVAFPINYKAKTWTEYAIKNYGPQVEKNPIVRRMYIKGNLTLYWVTWVCTYIFLLFCYTIAIYTLNWVFLIDPLLLIVLVLFDFLNDFYQLRKFKSTRDLIVS